MKIWNNLRFRLVILVLFAVIPALLVTLYSGLEQRDLAREAAENDSLRLARVTANHQSSLVEGARQLLLALSLAPELQQPTVTSCTDYFSMLRERYPMYSSLRVARPDGEIVCSTLPGESFISIADRAYFQDALRSKEFLVGEVVLSRLTNNTVLPIALPVLDGAGNVTSVLVASIDMQLITDMVRGLNLPPESVLLLIDETGTVLLREPGGEEFAGRQMPNAPLINAILTAPGEDRIQVAGLDGVDRFYGFTPLQTFGDQRMKVAMGIPSATAYFAADRLLWTNLMWIAFSSLLALLVAWYGGDLLFLRVVSLTAERDEAERQLREINQQLENRVAERTAALDAANRQLNIELLERQKVVHQLSEREIELERMVTVIERSNRELESFAYITSHDLQEPLRKIQAFGDRLSRRYAGSLDEEGENFLQRMVAAAGRMQTMINDLLDYSRVTTRNNPLVRVDLQQIAQEVLSDLELRIQEEGAEVQVGSLPVLRADASQMRQLLQNLIQNAVKFRHPERAPRVRIDCQRLPRSGSGPPMLEISVADNGIGFDEKYLDRIFLPFQRLHSQDAYQGSGIGLAICRKIAERHGGSLTAHSQPGSGSTFLVCLPDYSTEPHGENKDA